MGVDTGHGDIRDTGIYSLDVLILGGQEAVASHAGVQLEVRLGGCAELLRGGGQCRSRLRRADGCGRVCTHHDLRLVLHRGRAHDQNELGGVAVLAQGERILRLGDGEHCDAVLTQHLRHLQHAEAVAVRLEHRDDRYTGAVLDGLCVGSQLVRLYDKLFHLVSFVSFAFSAACSARWSPVRFFGLEVSRSLFFLRKRLRRRLR